MPVYQREGSPYWWYTFSIRGRRFRGSTGKTREKEARIDEAERYLKERDRPQQAEGWRLREVFGTYWTEHAQHRTDPDQIFYQLELMSVFLGKDLPIADLTNARLMDYRAARRGGGIMLDDAPSRPVAAQTVNRDLAYLAAALHWVRDVHGKPIPTIGWKRLKVKEAPHRVRFAGADEFARLLKGAHEAIRPMILCAVTTGLRKQNILQLQWHQVDLHGLTITLPHTKGDKPHQVSIAHALRADLARTEPKKRRGKVFDTTNFRKRWDAAVKAAEMEDFHFHDLRHTFASWARQNGADLADICDALNHSSVSVTMRYAHVKPQSQTTAFDRVAELLTSQRKAQRRIK
ncbi:site-specific integrase [soil metagenome]